MAAVLADEARDRAFEELYELHATDVYRYALAVCRNPADAEDVTQTTFMNAYRAFKSGERPRLPQNWLITIAHNACRTRAIRASRRPREVPLDDVVQKIAVPDQDRPSVREALSALSKLPFNQRAAIAMRELEGRSYTEIAQALGVSVPAVEALLFRGRRSLKLQRAAVRSLAVVQLPRSLRNLFGHANQAATASGALAGSGVAVKVAAVLVAGAVAGGVGYKVDTALLRHTPTPTPTHTQTHAHPATQAGGVLATHPARVQHKRATATRPAAGAASPAATGTAPAQTTSTVADTTAAAQSGPGPAVGAAAPAAGALPSTPATPSAAATVPRLPSHPTPPPAQVPPVQVPPVQVPPVQAPPTPLAPPAQVPPVQMPPVQTPPVQTPPVQTPPVQAPPLPPTPQVTTPQLPSAPAVPPAPVTTTLPAAPKVPGNPLP